MKKVLLDSSSAILLYKAGLFTKLKEVYCIKLAGTVYNELTCEGHPGAEEFRASDFTLFRASTSDVRLGSGERDTIAGYLEGLGDFLLTDDGPAARYCMKKQIPFINALLFPKILYLSEKLNETDYWSKTKELINLARYSKKVIQYAIYCSRNDLEFFLP